MTNHHHSKKRSDPLHRRFRHLVQGEGTTQDTVLFLLLTFGFVVAAVLLIWPIISLLLQVRDGILESGATTADRGADLRNYALVVAAMIGAPFVVWRLWISERQTRIAAQNRDLTEQRNLTDRFVKAVEMLGARDKDGAAVVEQRLGGIYALERLARESDADHVQIMEVLCAYIRENAPATKAIEWPGLVVERLREANPNIADAEIEADPAYVAACNGMALSVERLTSHEVFLGARWAESLPRPREDVRAALDTLGRRSDHQRALEDGHRLDLRGACLQGAGPYDKHFDKARFDYATLAGASFPKANLKATSFFRAHLQGANLDHADMQEATFFQAQLQGALMEGAELQGTNLSESNLQGTFLRGALT